MRRSAAVDGFSLAYEYRRPSAHARPERAAVLLHGWPGDHTDYRLVEPRLADDTHVVVPDLRPTGTRTTMTRRTGRKPRRAASPR